LLEPSPTVSSSGVSSTHSCADDPRCVLCHAPQLGARVVHCGCGCVVHSECFLELSAGGCPTIGCRSRDLRRAIVYGCPYCAAQLPAEDMDLLEHWYAQLGQLDSVRCESCERRLPSL